MNRTVANKNVHPQTSCVENYDSFPSMSLKQDGGGVPMLASAETSGSFRFGGSGHVGHHWAILHFPHKAPLRSQHPCHIHFTVMLRTLCVALSHPTSVFCSSEDPHGRMLSASCPRPFSTHPTAIFGLGFCFSLVPVQERKSLDQ